MSGGSPSQAFRYKIFQTPWISYTFLPKFSYTLLLKIDRIPTYATKYRIAFTSQLKSVIRKQNYFHSLVSWKAVLSKDGPSEAHGCLEILGLWERWVLAFIGWVDDNVCESEYWVTMAGSPSFKPLCAKQVWIGWNVVIWGWMVLFHSLSGHNF